MKKMLLKLLGCLAAVTLVLTGCTQHQAQRRETIAFVRQVASDSAGIFSLVQNYAENTSEGAIAICGEPEPVIRLTQAFLEADAVDNIDARYRKDGLPDFAGETFQAFLDPISAPYSHFLSSDPDSLRELTVRLVLFGVDTVSYSNPFNRGTAQWKNSCKMFILASPLQAEYGRFDADTLFKMGDKRITLIDPVESMAHAASGETPRHLLVIAADSLATVAAFRSALPYLPASSTIDVISRPEPGNELRSIIIRFSSLDKGYKLTDVLIDEDKEMFAHYRKSLTGILDRVADGDDMLARYLAPDIKIINQTDAVVSFCYFLLRDQNRFTHTIAYPKAYYYQLEESLLGEPVLVRVSDRYVTSTSNMREIQAQISHE